LLVGRSSNAALTEAHIGDQALKTEAIPGVESDLSQVLGLEINKTLSWKLLKGRA
jgi:hypothetical protein